MLRSDIAKFTEKVEVELSKIDI